MLSLLLFPQLLLVNLKFSLSLAKLKLLKLFHREPRPIILSVVHPFYYCERNFDIRASRKSIFWCRDPGEDNVDEWKVKQECNPNQ